MFKKREKKIFPPGTFIEKKARIAAILQLCFAFSMLLWIASQPFMGDLFATKSDMIVFETVFGTRNSLLTDSEGLLKRNGERFKNLSQEDKNLINGHYESLKKLSSASFKKKLEASFLLLTTNTAPFILAAIFFSIAIPLLLLMKYEGAISASFLLPAIIFFALCDNGSSLQASFNTMYPSEQEILETYLQEPLKASVLEQHRQLKRGWQLFLIAKWAKEFPSDDETTFKNQAEKGEHAFYVEQAKQMALKGFVLPSTIKNQKFSPLILLVFLMTSTCFAAAAVFSKKDMRGKT